MSVTERSPLPYQRSVAALLASDNPASFASLVPGAGDETDQLTQTLLRSAYRLEPNSHPTHHAALNKARVALGVAAPVEIWVEDGGGQPNAAYIHAPSRGYVLVTGPLLDLLDETETCAVFGHELAHRVLWTLDGGRYLAASRLLEAAETDARTPSAYVETARRFRLSIELFCDRGALLATGEVGPAISGLLKVSTGMRTVDPAAYLRQAAEIDFASGSARTSHPEPVLRAWALSRWATATAAGDVEHVEAEVAAVIGPALDLAALDLLDQDRLAELTRSLVRDAVQLDGLREPDAVDLAEQYGVTAPAAASPASAVATADLAELSADTRRYLCAVLTDLATADDTARDALTAALIIARSRGLGADLERFWKRELDLTDRERTALRDGADALTAGR